MEEKYVVFKSEDWKSFVEAHRAKGLRFEESIYAITDCFVIRFQDVLAGPGLHAYANAAQNMIDGVDVLDRALTGFSDAHPESRDLKVSLVRVRDAAFEAANIADNYPNKKVPD